MEDAIKQLDSGTPIYEELLYLSMAEDNFLRRFAAPVTLKLFDIYNTVNEGQYYDRIVDIINRVGQEAYEAGFAEPSEEYHGTIQLAPELTPEIMENILNDYNSNPNFALYLQQKVAPNIRIEEILEKINKNVNEFDEAANKDVDMSEVISFLDEGIKGDEYEIVPIEETENEEELREVRNLIQNYQNEKDTDISLRTIPEHRIDEALSELDKQEKDLINKIEASKKARRQAEPIKKNEIEGLFQKAKKELDEGVIKDDDYYIKKIKNLKELRKEKNYEFQANSLKIFKIGNPKTHEQEAALEKINDDQGALLKELHYIDTDLFEYNSEYQRFKLKQSEKSHDDDELSPKPKKNEKRKDISLETPGKHKKKKNDIEPIKYAGKVHLDYKTTDGKDKAISHKYSNKKSIHDMLAKVSKQNHSTQITYPMIENAINNKTVIKIPKKTKSGKQTGFITINIKPNK